MVKDHSDREREETCCHHYMLYSFQLAARVLLHATAFVTPVIEHWLEQEITHERSIQQPNVPWANALTTELHLAPSFKSTPDNASDEHCNTRLHTTRCSRGRVGELL